MAVADMGDSDLQKQLSNLKLLFEESMGQTAVQYQKITGFGAILGEGGRGR